jgi:hypothetical protein
LLLTILPRPRSSRWCFGERSCSHALGACGRRSLSHRREHVLCQPSSADAGDHCDLLPDVRICPRANVGDVVSRAVTPEGLVRAAIARSGPCRQRYVTGRRKGEIWPASREVALRNLTLGRPTRPWVCQVRSQIAVLWEFQPKKTFRDIFVATGMCHNKCFWIWNTPIVPR